MTPRGAGGRILGGLVRLLAVAGATFVLAAGAAARADWPTRGGDDGRAIEVTTLADRGAGSLRAALNLQGPRRIVFKVGGEIRLKDALVVRNPYVTIAGETAPSPGISLIGDKLRIRTHDVIVRDLRVRVGELPGSKPGNRDGISVESLAADRTPVGNVLIDHCSVAWALDEGISVYGRRVSNVLIRRSIAAETLHRSIHPKGRHSAGLLVGKKVQNVVVEGNLLVHNQYRNPAVAAGASAVVVNNVIYNPGFAGFHVYSKEGLGPTRVSVVGNLLIAGPDSRSLIRSFDKGLNRGSKVYYSDNRAIGAKAFNPSERAGQKVKEAVPFVDSPPIWFSWIKPLPASAIEDKVLADVGARPQDRDETDRRLIAEVSNRTGSIRDTPADASLQIQRPLSRNQSMDRNE